MLADALDEDVSADNAADSGNSGMQLLLVFHLLIFFLLQIWCLLSTDKTFNNRQEKEHQAVDPLGLFRVLPHSPAKKVVYCIHILIVFFFAFLILLVSFVPPGYQFPDASNPTAVTGTPAPPATVSTIFHTQNQVLP